MEKLKSEVLTALNEALDTRIEEIRAELSSLEDSRNSATKSTAGDKHETGRAMMQQEVDQQEKQLAAVLKMKADLKQIDNSVSDSIKPGSLVQTEAGYFLIAIPFGKLESPNATVHVISSAAPICAGMMGKKLGDSFQMAAKKVEILSVY